MKRLLLAFALLIFCFAFALAQETRQNIAPEKRTDAATTEAAATLFPYHPISAWTGKRFIFLPRPASSPADAYDDFIGSVRVQKFAGRVGKVISVGEFNGRAHVEFEMEDSGEHVRARTIVNKESLKGMALADDIETAHRQWAGKTVWCKAMMISSFDEQSGAVSMLRIKKYSPLKVAEVVAGWNEEAPVRLMLETADGKRGFLDLNLSGTNVQKDFRHVGRFGDNLLAEDPRLKYKWPAATWTAIENGRIVPGMTMDQVRMSWGDPEKIARTAAGEQWTYPGGVLLFKNGVMSGKRN
ncbi:MAG: hypothetical protein ACREEM_33650 [Blastocatellia bacterium]